MKVRKFFFLFQVFQVCVALADLELMEVEVMELKMCATNKRGGAEMVLNIAKYQPEGMGGSQCWVMWAEETA